MDLAQRLQVAMKQAPGGPMKAIDLAAKAKVTRSAISLLLGRKTLSLKSQNATKIASALGVSVEWLVDGKGPGPTGKEPALKASDPKVVATLTKAQQDLVTMIRIFAGQIPDEQARKIAKLIKETAGQAVAVDRALAKAKG